MRTAAYPELQATPTGIQCAETQEPGTSGERPTVRIGGDRADRALLTLPCSCEHREGKLRFHIGII